MADYQRGMGGNDKMVTPVYIGNDQGYYGTKVVCRHGDKFYKLFIRNMVVPSRVGGITQHNGPDDVMYRESEGDREWVVGKLGIDESADDEPFDSDERRLCSRAWFREKEYLIMCRVSTGLRLQGCKEPIVSVA